MTWAGMVARGVAPSRQPNRVGCLSRLAVGIGAKNNNGPRASVSSTSSWRRPTTRALPLPRVIDAWIHLVQQRGHGVFTIQRFRAGPGVSRRRARQSPSTLTTLWSSHTSLVILLDVTDSTSDPSEELVLRGGRLRCRPSEPRQRFSPPQAADAALVVKLTLAPMNNRFLRGESDLCLLPGFAPTPLPLHKEFPPTTDGLPTAPTDGRPLLASKATTAPHGTSPDSTQRGKTYVPGCPHDDDTRRLNAVLFPGRT